MTTLDERVIELHDIARQIEQEVGAGTLSENIRKSADKLSKLLKKEDRRETKSKLGYSRIGLNNV